MTRPARIKTTCIGAYPKPGFVTLPDWFSANDPRLLQGVTRSYGDAVASLSEDALEEMLLRGVGAVIRDQVDAGIDIPTDGEIPRENRERLLETRGDDTVVFEAVTTGNYSGFDVWLEDGHSGELQVSTNLGDLRASLADVDMEGVTMDAGGLERKIRVYRLPDDNPARELNTSVSVPLRAKGDNPLWVSVYTEDGFQAWSSPIFVYNEDDWPGAPAQ